MIMKINFRIEAVFCFLARSDIKSLSRTLTIRIVNVEQITNAARLLDDVSKHEE